MNHPLSVPEILIDRVTALEAVRIYAEKIKADLASGVYNIATSEWKAGFSGANTDLLKLVSFLESN